MSKKETLEKVKDRQGLFAKIQNIFGLGYATREDLRKSTRSFATFTVQILRVYAISGRRST